MCVNRGELVVGTQTSYLRMFDIKMLFDQGKVYMFDKVLKPNVTQTQVYDATAKNIVKGEKYFDI